MGCSFDFLGQAAFQCQLCVVFGVDSPPCLDCVKNGAGQNAYLEFLTCGFGMLCADFLALGDGVCDQVNNNEACSNDLGDCCTLVEGDATNDEMVNVLDVVDVSCGGLL